MADWNQPLLTSTYVDFLAEIKARDSDLALQFDGASPSNTPTGAIRWSSSANRWQKWTGSAWGELTNTYALTALTTTGNVSVGGSLTVTGSVSFTSTTATATTQAVDNNSLSVATTAFVVGQAGAATPNANGTAAVGSSLRYSRQDHVHPADTSRAPLASPTFTGTVTIPAGASISGFATTASPTFTGTPVAPTAAVGTSTTQLATTAFVAANKLVAMTAQNSTSGTSLDFTGIPSWVKRITVMFKGVGTSGSSHVLIRAGISTGFVATGYLGVGNLIQPGTSATVLSASSTAGFLIYNSSGSQLNHGCVRLTLLNQASNAWVADGLLGLSTGSTATKNTGGSVDLSGALDRIRITTVNGTDTFNAGSINVMYE